MKIWGAVCLFLFCFLPGAGAAALYFETHTFTPSLGIGLQNQAFNSGSALDLADMLEIRDESAQLSRVYFGDDFRVSYLDLNYAGQKPLAVSGGDALTLGSALDFSYWSAGWFTPLIQKENFRANLLFDVKSYRVGGQLGAFFRDREIALAGKSSFSGIAPAVGATVQGNATERLFLYAEAAGLPMGRHGSFWEFDAGFQYKVKDRMFMQIGYKSFDLKTNNEALSTNLQATIKGPYFGLNFSI